jgi:DNA-binding MarR family transcriptional regulator
MSSPQVKTILKTSSDPGVFREIGDILSAVTHIAARCEADLAEAAEKHDLVAAQAAVLVTLLRGGPTRMSALSHSLECDAGNLSGMIDRLEEAGHVARSTSATDRRVRVLSLTTAGRRVATKLEHRLNESRLLAALTTLDPVERAAFGRTLEKVLASSNPR